MNRRAHVSLPSCSKSWKAIRYGERPIAPQIHVPRIREEQILELMNGRRSGNTTAPNRSIAIRSRLSIDTTQDRYFKKGTTLQRVWPSRPSLINQYSTKNSTKSSGRPKNDSTISDKAMFKMK